MPGRPTNGNLSPSQWTSSTMAAQPRRYISSSAGDLTSPGVFYGQQRHPSSRSGVEPRRQTSAEIRMIPSDDGSVVFSDIENEGIAIARVSQHHSVCALSLSSLQGLSVSSKPCNYMD